MTPQSLPRKLTYEDFVLLPDDGLRHEIIDGRHYVTPAPFSPHQRVVGNLYYLLRSFLEERPLGSVWLAPLDVLLSLHDIVEPDLILMTRATEERILTEKHIRGTPDILIEVLSRGTRSRDLGIKKTRYALTGVREYWVVDPAEGSIRVHRLAGEDYGEADLLLAARDDTLTTPLLEGLALPLCKVFQGGNAPSGPKGA